MFVVAIATAILGMCATVIAPSAVGASIISPNTLATAPAHIGDPFLAALSFENGASWSVTSGQLPPGLTLGNGQITGVPTAGGAYTFIVRATGSSTVSRKYTILVNLPTSTGYDARMHSVIFARDASPSPKACNHTSYATYAIADLWMNRNPSDVNTKLASLKFSHYGGDPSACSAHSNQARNNLKLAFLVRAYMLYNSTSSFFPGRLTPAAAKNLVAQMWTYASKYSKFREAANTWSIYDSENHDAQAEGFYFMAAQIFKNTPGYRNKVYADHTTVSQQFKAWRDHWSNYFDQRAKRDLFVEVAAPTYHVYTIEPILNIYDFANDPVLRKKAEMILDLDFADYAQQSLNNIWGGAKSRSYPADSYNGAADSMTDLGDLLWGPAATVAGDQHALMLATSGYSPPPVVQSIATNHAGLGSFAYTTRRPGGGAKHSDGQGDQHVAPLQSVLSYAYVTPDYVLGSTDLYPGEVEVASSAQNRWEGITFDAGGAARIYPQTGPLGLSHSYDAFLSMQHKSVLITEKRAYTDNATLVYFPNTLTNLVARGGWLFAQQGPSFVAVRPVLGRYHWLTAKKNKAGAAAQRFISLSDTGSPIIFEAGLAGDYGSFSAFQTRILHNSLKRTSAVVNYTASDGTKFTMYTDPGVAPKINGHLLQYSPPLGFNSPFMHSVWGSGKLTVTFGSQSATYNFSKPNAPGKSVH